MTDRGVTPSEVDLLIISDSSAFRERAGEALQQITMIRVATSECDSPTLEQRLGETSLQILVLDIGLNEDRGLGILQAIRAENRRRSEAREIHLILLTRFTPAVVNVLPDVMAEGHLDHLLHPNGSEADIDLIDSLVIKTSRVLASRSNTRVAEILPCLTPVPEPTERACAEAVLIGTSTGGPQALATLLPSLSRLTDVPIFVVQHIPAIFTAQLAESLNGRCNAVVKEAEDGELVKAGHIYIAPGNQHLVLGRTQYSVRTFLTDDAPDNGCRPSVNNLFLSGPQVYANRLVAAILTGMGTDGTEGAMALKAAEVPVYVQDESSSVVWGMPGSAVRVGAVTGTYPLDELAERIADHTVKGRSGLWR